MGSFVVNPYSMMSRASDLSAYVSTKGDSFCEYLKVKRENKIDTVASVRSCYSGGRCNGHGSLTFGESVDHPFRLKETLLYLGIARH